MATSYISCMLKDNSARVVDARVDLAEPADGDAEIFDINDIDDVARRRERLAAYAEASRPVIIYRFWLPDGATSAAPAGGEPRDARNLLHVLVGLTGGSIAKSHGGLAARIPKISAAKFEGLARSLIEAHLVSIELDEAPEFGVATA